MSLQMNNDTKNVLNNELPIKDWRRCVGVLVFNNFGEILIGKRSSNKKSAVGKWQPPQGGIKKEEVIIDAAKRELFEEVGLSFDKYKLQIVSELPKTLEYVIPDEFRHSNFKYRGQRMNWVLMYWNNADVKQCKLDVQEDQEFDEIKFGSWEEITGELTSVPFKIELYKCLKQLAQPIIQNYIKLQVESHD